MLAIIKNTFGYKYGLYLEH